MPILRCVVIEQQPPDVGKNTFRTASREAFQKVGEFWWREYMPDHFRPYSGAKYGYKPRTADYQRRKEALARRGIVRQGGRAPLVFRGDMEEAMRRSASIRAFPTRCTVQIEAPRYVTFRPRGNQPNKAQEVTRVLPYQQRRMEEMHRDHVTKRLNEFRATRKTKVEG